MVNLKKIQQAVGNRVAVTIHYLLSIPRFALCFHLR
jgi:hypothetical protein